MNFWIDPLKECFDEYCSRFPKIEYDAYNPTRPENFDGFEVRMILRHPLLQEQELAFRYHRGTKRDSCIEFFLNGIDEFRARVINAMVPDLETHP